MNKGFIKYIKEKQDVFKIAIVLALGLVLIFLGGRGDGTAHVTEEGTEEKIATACSRIAGVGECEVFLCYSASDSRGEGEVESVIVICDGADSVEVRYRLTEMLSSFFGIGANRIKVEKKSS